MTNGPIGSQVWRTRTAAAAVAVSLIAGFALAILFSWWFHSRSGPTIDLVSDAGVVTDKWDWSARVFPWTTFSAIIAACVGFTVWLARHQAKVSELQKKKEELEQREKLHADEMAKKVAEIEQREAELERRSLEHVDQLELKGRQYKESSRESRFRALVDTIGTAGPDKATGRIAALYQLPEYLVDSPHRDAARGILWAVLQETSMLQSSSGESPGRFAPMVHDTAVEILCTVRRDLKGAKLPGVRLDIVDLAGANLQGADLWRAACEKTNLSGSDLRRARLTGAWLKRCQLDEADLGGADLSSARLQRSSLRSASLIECNLDRALLDGADLTGAELRGASLKWARFDSDTLWPDGFEHGACGAVGPGVVLRELRFPDGLLLERVDLSNSELGGSTLTKAMLAEACLREAHLDDVSMVGAMLASADLTNASLNGANLTQANLQGAKMGGANLRGADLTKADLSGAWLDDAKLEGATWDGAVLDGVRVSEANRSILVSAGFEEAVLELMCDVGEPGEQP